MHDDGIEKALNAIHAGGHQLVMLVRTRVAQLLDELDRGDFRNALNYVGDISQSVGALAQAQGTIAIAEGSHLVKALDLEVGMELTDIGVIEEKTTEECGHTRCNGHVKVKVGTHEMASAGNAEFFVRDAPAEELGG